MRLWLWLLTTCFLVAFSVHAVPSPPSPVRQCCSGQRLRISWCWGDVVPYFKKDKITGLVEGFVPDMLQLIADEMDLQIEFDLVPIFVDNVTGEPTAEMNMDNWGADFILFDLGHTNAFFGLQSFFGRFYNAAPEVMALYNSPSFQRFVERWPELVSTSMLSSRYSALIRTTRAMSDHWRLFDPFEPEVWLSIVAALFIFSFALLLIEPAHRRPATAAPAPGCWPLTCAAVGALYHMWAMLLSGEELEWRTGPGRVLRVGLLFFAILTTSTYTANLAAFFTAPGLVYHGPQDMAQLRVAKAFVIEAEEALQVQPFAKQVVAAYGTAPGVQGILGPAMEDVEKAISHGVEMLKAGEVDVFLGDGPLLLAVQKRYCRDTAIAHDISFGKWGFFLALPATPPQSLLLASHLQRVGREQAALQWVSNIQAFQALEQHHFGSGEPCQTGVYVITGIFIAAALLCALVQHLFPCAGAGDAGSRAENSEDKDRKAGAMPGLDGGRGGGVEEVLRRLERIEHSLARPPAPPLLRPAPAEPLATETKGRSKVEAEVGTLSVEGGGPDARRS